MSFFRRLVIAVRWLFSPDAHQSPAEQDLFRRNITLELQASDLAHEKEKLEAQLKVRDLAVKEMIDWHELSRARVEAWTAIHQATAVRAETKDR